MLLQRESYAFSHKKGTFFTQKRKKANYGLLYSSLRLLCFSLVSL